MDLQSFRARVSLIIGGMALVLVALLSVAVDKLLTHRLTADSGAALHSLGRGVAGVLAGGLRSRLQDIELLAASAFVAHWSDHRAEVQGSLNRLMRGGQSFTWVGLVDPQGTVQVSTGQMLLGLSVAQRPWFEAGRDGPHIGDVHPAKLLASLLPSRPAGPPRFVDFAAPVYGPDGGLRGVLGGHGDWAFAAEVISQLRSELDASRSVEVYIVGADGKVLHRPGGQPAETERIDLAVLGVPRGPGALAVMATWPDGERYLTSALSLPPTPIASNLDWTVLVRQHESQALAAAREVRLVVVGLGLVAAVLVMLISGWMAGRISRPLQQIANAAQSIERGELGARIPGLSRASTELRRLASALQGMTQALQDGKSALQQANSSLEERVRERTAALAQANQELEALARRDGLTGLLNRRSADERLSLELARHLRHGHDLCVLMVDVDHFKRINDEHGHAMGDLALREVASCLAAQCRATDVVARFGGEEFIVLLPDTSPTAARRVAEKLRAAVASLQVPGLWPLSVSIGVAQASGRVPSTGVLQAGVPSLGAEPQTLTPAVAPNELPAPPTPFTQSLAVRDLLRRADTALYTAKASGRNRVVVFEPQAQVA